MQQFTLSGGEIVLKQNMSETIIGNHAAFINPKEIQWMKFHWCYDFFFFFFNFVLCQWRIHMYNYGLKLTGNFCIQI